MKHLFNFKLFENKEEADDLLNQICYELSDLGFHSREDSEVKVQPTDGDKEKSVIFIQKYTEWDAPFFYFSEIKDAVYRLKDVIGIDKIDTINFLRPGHTNYEILSFSSFRLECIDDFELISMFIVFNY
jgi:hypothetical protein